MWMIFASALAVGFSGAMMPGSLLTYTIRQALTEGPRAGFVITLGHALLELALVILIFLGFDMILQSKAAQFAIGLLGGALLIYLGADMIVKAAKNRVSVDTEGKGGKGGNMFVSGIVISAANPYFLLWWAVVGLGFVMQSYKDLGYIGVGVYYIGHICADFIWYGAISVIIGKTRKFIKDKPYRIIIAILGAVLVFFGARFVYGAIAGLV
jgi:threonine/homoserine/homoserine lactone efflux protein